MTDKIVLSVIPVLVLIISVVSIVRAALRKDTCGVEIVDLPVDTSHCLDGGEKPSRGGEAEQVEDGVLS